jgi:hypothetical protein
MVMNNLWKRKTAVIVAAVFLLTLCALDLDALLLQGKADVSQAQAVNFQIHWRHAITDSHGQVQCPTEGFDCVLIVFAGKEIIIPLIP